MTSGKQRVSLALFLLSIILGAGWMQQAQAQALSVESVTIIVTVTNDMPEEIHVRIVTGGEVLVNQVLQPDERVSFSLEPKNCHQSLRAFVNGHSQGRLSGNLCPELYPDEQKEIYFLRTGKVVILGEDRR